jgi:hypothetical protein
MTYSVCVTFSFFIHLLFQFVLCSIENGLLEKSDKMKYLFYIS